jgi:hypothetical protein
MAGSPAPEGNPTVKDHFAELAEQIASDIPEALGCVLVSFDGEPLAAHPPHVLDLLKPLSVKLSRLSGIRRAFLEFGGSSLFSLSRTTYAVVIVTAQSVDHEAVLERFEEVVDHAEVAETKASEAGPSLSDLPDVPEFVAAEASAAPTNSAASTDQEHENTVGLAQEFSSLLAESFGGDQEEAETTQAEAAS